MIQIVSTYSSVMAECPKVVFYYGPVEESEEFLFTVTKMVKLYFL